MTSPLNVRMLEEISVSAGKSEVFKLMSDVLDYADNKREVLLKQIETVKAGMDKVNFGDILWKGIVS